MVYFTVCRAAIKNRNKWIILNRDFKKELINILLFSELMDDRTLDKAFALLQTLLIQKQPAEVFYEKRYSWKFHKIRKKTHFLSPTQVFFCEFSEIPKNSFSTVHLRTTASFNNSISIFLNFNSQHTFISSNFLHNCFGFRNHRRS